MSGSRGAKDKKSRKLEAHSGTEGHLTSMVRWAGHKSKNTHGSVHSQLISNHKLVVESNRKYVKMLIDIVIYIASQGLAYRGHDESKTSLNQGTFIYNISLKIM